MYNALIIDDEKHVRQTIFALGKWEENRIAPPLFAPNGEDALAMMEANPVNLVLVDIKMPVMDGMQFIERAAKRFPKCKYVVVSGFSDFEYAKKAIQFQVMDYLLKPVSGDELNQCLSKAIKELDDDYERINENPVMDLINRICAYTPDGFHCAIAAVRIANSHVCIWDSYTVQTFQNCLNHSPPDVKYLSIAQKPYLFLLGIMLPNTAGQIPIGQKAKKHLTQAASEMFHQTKIALLVGIGSFAAPSLAELKGSCQTSLHLVNRMDLSSQVPVIIDDEAAIGSWKPHSLSSKKEILKRAMEKGDVSYFERLLELYFEALKVKGLITAELLANNSVELLLLMQEFAQETCTEKYRLILPSLNELEQLDGLFSTNEVITYFCSLFSQLCQLTDPDHQMTIKFILQEIKAYIEERYPCDITLTFFSGKYHMTKEYLSKQFKEQYGYGIYEYVLAFRMEKAGEALLCTDMKVSEISGHVGYPDTNYFSKAFKTFYGLSPKEYRQKNQQAIKNHGGIDDETDKII